jgi:hypothetical protein
MYNSYLGQQQQQQQQQQPPNPQGFQSPYQLPQQTGYQPPYQPQQQQQLQQQPTGQFPLQQTFLQNQATGYANIGRAPSLVPGQYGVPPIPAIPTQYAAQQTQQQQPMAMQPTGFATPYGSFSGPSSSPMQLPTQSPAATGHSRKTSTAAGTSTRIPNGITTWEIPDSDDFCSPAHVPYDAGPDQV